MNDNDYRAVTVATDLFREVMRAHLIRQAVDGVIKCAQIEPLTEQNATAFRGLLLRRLNGEIDAA